MRVIEFRVVTNTGDEKIVAVAKMHEKKTIVISLDKNPRDELQEPVYNTRLKNRVTMADGDAWLEALPYNYAGSRFYAAEKKEEAPVVS